VTSVDVTIVAEAVRIAPHREAMRRRVASVLDLEISHVSVKATTTDGLGFTGRDEGIAAMAVASVAGHGEVT
jgi:2-C-methyl-D-erythritol 4-phosphate cytidylyltransferase/2-C-methyl-D-erythritol 2,4-cyclodiphosphate synthase